VIKRDKTMGFASIVMAVSGNGCEWDRMVDEDEQEKRSIGRRNSQKLSARQNQISIGLDAYILNHAFNENISNRRLKQLSYFFDSSKNLKPLGATSAEFTQ
jgi:hypothetical protein